MKISGHWFCEHCDDVVTLPAPIGANPSPEKCPVCNHRTAVWIPHVENHRPVNDETARGWFQQMREIVNTAAPSK